MEKRKNYNNAIFKAEVFKESLEILKSSFSDKDTALHYSTTQVEENDTEFVFDNDEEFFAEYRKPGISSATFTKSFKNGTKLQIYVFKRSYVLTRVVVEAKDRKTIESVFNVFEHNLTDSQVPVPEVVKTPPVVFIGHGHSGQWKDLKDHLHEKHDYKIEAYEIGARAGHAIRDILESMMKKSSFALLVMTGEDLDFEGKLHPRDNVIHELGLFQGSIGFNKAIVLLESETEEFSNIHGIQQIRFSKGNIKETFGEIVATLKREFE